jgi:ribosomal protein S18 acetylase RimI-like enzyme
MRRALHIEPLARGEMAEAGDLLGRAFSENPVARVVLSHFDAGERLARVSRLNRVLVAMGHRFGVVDVVRESGRLLGVSIHFPSGAWPVSGAGALPFQLRAGLGVGARGAYRYLVYEREVEPHHFPDPHAYLFVLGVEPELQGRGIGAALLRAFCDRADVDGLPCWLETDKESSVRLYQRHGFEVVREIDVAPLEDLHVWFMLRKAEAER